MDRIIQSYIDYLSDNKLKTEYNNLIQHKNIISKNIYDILSQNPNIIGKSIEQQIGGELSQGDVDKVKRLKELFDAYKTSIGEKDFLPNIDVVRNILTSLKQNVDESKTSLQRLVAPQYLPQDLQVVLTSLKSNTDPKGFLEKINGLYNITVPDISTDDNFKKYKTLRANLESAIKKISDQLKDFDDTNTQLSADIEKQIAEQRAILDKASFELMSIKSNYESTIKSITENLQRKPLINPNIFFDPNDKSQKDIDDTERVYNQLITPVGQTGVVTQINNNIKDLINDIEIGGINYGITPEDVSKIYDADFKINDRGEVSIESKYNKKTGPPLRGGLRAELMNKIISLQTDVNKFKKIFDEYKVVFAEYNYLQIRNINHVIYSMMVLTNAVYNVPNYIIFKNVGRGTVNFYLRIINNIYDNLQDPKQIKDPLLGFIRKRHYVTIIKLKYFLEEINKKFTSSSMKLRISKADSYTKQMFTILSHFRRILEDYTIQKLSKVSIYARINYIKHKMNEQEEKDYESKDPKGKEQFDFRGYENNAMFISDTERLTLEYKLNEKFNRITDTGFLSSITNDKKREEETKKINEINDKFEKEIQAGKLNKEKLLSLRDDRLMWVRRDACPTFEKNQELSTKYPPYRQIQFTEVFDTRQYAHNEDISRYMNLASRLSTGNGICLITYGYSGTGKTYTLFGKIDEGKEIKGLLQSTLSQLNGLIGVHFRLFELYGYGFSHPDYWVNIDGTPRIDSINHKVVEYKLTGGDELQMESTVDHNSLDIKQFIEHVKDLRGIDMNNQWQNFYNQDGTGRTGKSEGYINKIHLQILQDQKFH